MNKCLKRLKNKRSLQACKDLLINLNIFYYNHALHGILDKTKINARV